MAQEGSFDYSVYSDVIEQVVHYYINIRRVRIPDMDAQDIAQEIRLKCVQALESDQYDPDKTPDGSPYSFLVRCIHNRLYNLKRGVWTPNNPPCVRCPCWDKKLKKCVLDGGEQACEKMVRYREAMRVKASLRTPIGFDRHCTEGQSLIFDSIDEFELHDLISNSLPPKLLGYYNDLRNGVSIQPRKKNELRRAIMKILQEE